MLVYECSGGLGIIGIVWTIHKVGLGIFILLCGTTKPVRALSRQAALVTGSTDGIGVTTAKHLASKGYDVLIHGRDQSRIERAKNTVEGFVEDHSNDPGRVFTLPARDLSTISDCKRLGNDVLQLCRQEGLELAVLMNNAGVYSEKLVVTEDGLEQTFAVNVVAPFVVTSKVLPELLERKSRIVIASSISQCATIRSWDDLHYSSRPFSPHASYSESKLLDAMLSHEIADRLVQAGYPPSKITCNCLDPGTVNTKMLLAGWGPCGIDVEDALDQTWLCTSPDVDGVTGKYYVYQTDRPARASAYNQGERDKLWSLLASLAPDCSEIWNFEAYSR